MEQSVAVASGESAADAGQHRGVRRGRPRVYSNWCKSCGLCIAFCPQSVFEPNGGGQAAVAHPERCTACDWCRFHCPDLAITVAHFDEGAEGGWM